MFVFFFNLQKKCIYWTDERVAVDELVLNPLLQKKKKIEWPTKLIETISNV